MFRVVKLLFVLSCFPKNASFSFFGRAVALSPGVVKEKLLAFSDKATPKEGYKFQLKHRRLQLKSMGRFLFSKVG